MEDPRNPWGRAAGAGRRRSRRLEHACLDEQSSEALNPKPAHQPSPSVGRWAPSSASETMAGSARLQSLPTTPLTGSPSLVAKPLYQYTLTLNPTKLLSRGSRPPTLQGDRAVSKWTRVGAPPDLSRLANEQGLGAPNPSRLGAAAPQPSTTCRWTRVGPPPNPSRLANRQGLGAPPTPHDLGRQGPPTLHDLQMDKVGHPNHGHGLGPPTLHDLQMDKGWGPPTPHDLGRQGTPTPSRLANLQMDKGGPPNPSRLANGQGLGPPPTLHDLQIDLGRQGPQPFRT